METNAIAKNAEGQNEHNRTRRADSIVKGRKANAYNCR
jgi:hypothetical protein